MDGFILILIMSCSGFLASGDFVETAYTTSGQVASVTDKHGVTAYSYDGQDRLIKVSYPNGEAIDYTYDAAGNRTQVKTQHSIVDYSFDELNRLQTVTEGLNVTSYTYDKVGNRASVNYANGTSIEYQYNNLNRLTKVTHKDGSGNVTQQFDYTLGLAGNRLQIAELTGRVVDYTYDKLYRLTSEVVTDVVNGNRTASFTYDKVGNRLTQIESGITTTYSYNDNDQILEEYDGSVLTSYEYDANGNTTKKVKGSEVTNYDYSQDNRLLRATTPAEVIDYSYDASGIRQSKSVNGAATHYLVDQNRDYAQVISELDELGNAQINYVYGDDLISQTQSSQEHYFMYDGLGSTRSLTNSAGVETDSYIYEAFGEIEHKDGSTPNNYLFTGEQYDPNLGFYYLRARYYNQANGRFFTLDTYQGSKFEPEELHKYLYSKANPVMFVDPSGNIFVGGGIAGVGIGLNTSATLRFGSVQAGRAAFKRILFGNPPKDGGIVGELILEYALMGVFDILESSVNLAIKDSQGKGFKNKGAFGTRAHKHLESLITSYEPLPNLTVTAEVYVEDGSKKKKVKKGKFPKGALSVDIDVEYQGKHVLGIDLKTGKGWSKKGVSARKSRFGGNIIQIYFDVDGK